MFRSRTTKAALAFTLAMAGTSLTALADQGHASHHGANGANGAPQAGAAQMPGVPQAGKQDGPQNAPGGGMMSGGMMGDMMGSMMGQHMQMMRAMMGDPLKAADHMMDRDLMMLMQGAMTAPFDGSDDMSPEDAAHERLQSLFSGADSDGDGTLSIDEFDALHAQLLRARMVDRFQHLDADGNGQITADEITAPAERMSAHMGQMGGMMKGGMMQGGMMGGGMMGGARPGNMPGAMQGMQGMQGMSPDMTPENMPMAQPEQPAAAEN